MRVGLVSVMGEGIGENDNLDHVELVVVGSKVGLVTGEIPRPHRVAIH